MIVCIQHLIFFRKETLASFKINVALTLLSGSLASEVSAEVPAEIPDNQQVEINQVDQHVDVIQDIDVIEDSDDDDVIKKNKACNVPEKVVIMVIS